jgi:thiamine transport system substrate-binding protein
MHGGRYARRAARPLLGGVLAVVLAVTVAGCGGGDDGGGADGTGAPTSPAQRVVLVTHDSFAVSDDVLAAFTARTGIEIEVQRGGDAGVVLNQAILTKDEPLGDVLYGVDSTFLGRALDEDLFVRYEAAGLDAVSADLQLDPEHRVTPVDYGDVCLNYDRAMFGEELAPPSSLDDLVRPEYRGMTVVENPASSSPGLAFLLATIAEFGDGPGTSGAGGAIADWRDYWARLRANDVLVADGWEEAYYGSFSAGGEGGDRPIVVSYASSPPADVVFSDPPRTEPLIGVVESSCYRQVEFAGILRGTEREAAARQVVDFLLSRELQEDVPLQMFVFPARSDAAIPDVFRQWAAQPEHPYELPPDDVNAHRDEWIEEWDEIVLR